MSFYSNVAPRSQSNPIGSRTSTIMNPYRSSIQLYHQVFKERKILLSNQSKLKNRLNMVEQIQNRIHRQSNIKFKQQEYKLKYKSMYLRNPFNNNGPLAASIYRATQSRKKPIQEKQNTDGIQEMKKASEEYKKTIEKNKKMQKERKNYMVNKVKQQRQQTKKTITQFKQMRASRVQKMIQLKIQDEKNRCIKVSKNIKKLSQSCHKNNKSYVMESLDNLPTKTYLFTKIL